MRISALWITKNESAKICRSIGSVKAVADELLVVDTGSADDTVALAKTEGARVEKFDWCDDFSAARNFALSLTDADIVIFLDADEWFEPALGERDRGSIERLFAENVYLLHVDRREIDDSGREFGTQICPRILRKLPDCHYIRKIHEYYTSDTDKSRSTGFYDHKLMHDGYLKEISADKLAKYIPMLEAEILEYAACPNHSIPLMDRLYLVREYYNAGDVAKATAHLEALLDVSGGAAKVMKAYGQSIMHAVVLAVQICAIHIKGRYDDMKRELIGPFLTLYRGSRVCATLELFADMQLRFEGEYLKSNIDNALNSADRYDMTVNIEQEYKLCEGVLCRLASAAYLESGDRSKAFDYAARMIELGVFLFEGIDFDILMECVRGTSADEVILYLDSMFDTRDKDILSKMLPVLSKRGFSTEYTYYRKRLRSVEL